MLSKCLGHSGNSLLSMTFNNSQEKTRVGSAPYHHCISYSGDATPQQMPACFSVNNSQKICPSIQSKYILRLFCKLSTVLGTLDTNINLTWF